MLEPQRGAIAQDDVAVRLRGPRRPPVHHDRPQPGVRRHLPDGLLAPLVPACDPRTRQAEQIGRGLNGAAEPRRFARRHRTLESGDAPRFESLDSVHVGRLSRRDRRPDPRGIASVVAGQPRMRRTKRRGERWARGPPAPARRRRRDRIRRSRRVEREGPPRRRSAEDPTVVACRPAPSGPAAQPRPRRPALRPRPTSATMTVRMAGACRQARPPAGGPAISDAKAVTADCVPEQQADRDRDRERKTGPDGGGPRQRRRSGEARICRAPPQGQVDETGERHDGAGADGQRPGAERHSLGRDRRDDQAGGESRNRDRGAEQRAHVQRRRRSRRAVR